MILELLTLTCQIVTLTALVTDILPTYCKAKNIGFSIKDWLIIGAITLIILLVVCVLGLLLYWII